MRELENSTVRHDVRPWEWDRFDDEDENEDEEVFEDDEIDEFQLLFNRGKQIVLVRVSVQSL